MVGRAGKLVTRGAGRVAVEIETAMRNRPVVPLSRQIRAWRRGFYADQSLLYDLDRFGFEAYVSDFQRAIRLGRLNGMPEVLDDKLLFYFFARELCVSTPTVYGFTHRGDAVFFDNVGRKGGLLGLLAAKDRLVVKARYGTGGRNISFLEWNGGRPKVNGQECRQVEAVLRGPDFIVSDFAQQHQYSRDIYPATTNTMRVIALRRSDAEEPFVAIAVHRFGTSRSEPVDHFENGGLSACIDLETGSLSRAVARGRVPSGAPRELVWVDNHPETLARVTGIVIPHWSRVLVEVRRLTSAIPGSRYIGWDVVVTDEGPCFLEGNNRSGIALLQVHKPLLLDERVRAFFG